MSRRLLILLLNAAVVLSGVLSGPCASSAACPMARAQHSNCCDSMKPGIGTPRCCTSRQQLSRGAMATTTNVRPLHGTLVAAAVHVAPTAAAVSTAQHAAGPPRITVGPAPPGGTLIAQHTSLLL
jgi:hypothetical protein